MPVIGTDRTHSRHFSVHYSSPVPPINGRESLKHPHRQPCNFHCNLGLAGCRSLNHEDLEMAVLLAEDAPALELSRADFTLCTTFWQVLRHSAMVDLGLSLSPSLRSLLPQSEKHPVDFGGIALTYIWLASLSCEGILVIPLPVFFDCLSTSLHRAFQIHTLFAG